MPDKVYVISRLGHPLMPCSLAKARHLLDDKKAKVVKRMPFTIRLLSKIQANEKWPSVCFVPETIRFRTISVR